MFLKPCFTHPCPPLATAEVYGEDSTYGLERKLAGQTHQEVRLGSKQAAAIKARASMGASASSDDLLYATRVSRGTADLDAIDTFYLDAMGATLEVAAKGGNIIGDLPPYEAFQIGGANSVRGYPEGGVGTGRCVSSLHLKSHLIPA